MKLWVITMANEQGIVVTEVINNNSENYINSSVFDGYNITKFKELLSEEESEETVGHILSNAYQSICYFKNPVNDNDPQNPSKVLCLGKVQSGKTSFFLDTTALAFDNGYDIAYILGGTKLKLKKQNLGRVIDSFKNNERIKIFDVNNSFDEDIPSLIADGYKIILVILKNAAENTNLGKLKEFSIKYNDIPAVIVDDEGDEYTPGAEKAKKKNNKAGRTHDKIVDIITSFKTCTFLSVTATPQANLLVSTYDGISPNRLVLVQPGKGYTGGHAFFDTKDNPHVRVINDNDDFIDSIPDTFKEALYLFIFSCCLKRSVGDYKPLSMLVHPSSFNAIQNIVAMRIENFIATSIIPATENKNSFQYDDLINEMENALKSYEKMNGVKLDSFESVISELDDVIENLKIQIINYGASDDTEEEGPLYKIKVGGNMLGRGLTIDRLIISYIYRDSKEAQVDTMYQRCRWFGYKRKYFDVCKVFMTLELQQKFMAIVSNEDHMWNSMEAFLDTQINLKKFKRVFLLENDKLVLTRRTVANTVTLKVISSGNKADECIDLSETEKEHNRNVYIEYCNKHKTEGEFVDFDSSAEHNQRHLLLRVDFNDFYAEFLSKIVFAYGSQFSSSVFEAIVEKIKKGEHPRELLVMIMRFGRGESRSPSDGTMMNISRLFQGRNDGTNFSGDRYPVDINGNDYSKVSFIQIHMVDVYNKEPQLNSSIPLISYNNPLTAEVIKMVTGDNVYEE